MSYLIDVYDLRYPSPVSLAKIVVNKIALELWRQEIRNHRTNGTLEELDFKNSISSSILHPYVPSLLLDTIDEKITHVGHSLSRWVECYKEYPICQSNVLRYFDDLVCDFDGSIDYGKTAKRMVHCDEISQVAKFKIACHYCFEDDIALLWPSVSSMFHLRNVDCDKNPLMFYWIARLRNQLYKIPGNIYIVSNSLVSSMVFHLRCMNYPWPSIEYFLNRCNASQQKSLLKAMLQLRVHFTRYVLGKLNEEELDKWWTDNKADWSSDTTLLIWLHGKNEKTVDDFVNLLHQNLPRPHNHEILTEIWINAPDHFKQSAIQRVLLEDSFIRKQVSKAITSSFQKAKYPLNFILTVLSDFSIQDRRQFWNKNWVELLWMMNRSNFQQLMAKCLENNDEIIRFKETVMSDYEKISEYCSKAFKKGEFEKLHDVLNFCIVEEQTIRRIQLKLLKKDFTINRALLAKAGSYNRFIDDVLNDVDRATKKKRLFLSQPVLVKEFEGFVNNGLFGLVRNFIETVLPLDPIAIDFKKNVLLPALKNCLTNGDYLFKLGDVDYRNFSRWCLENDGEIAAFKQTLPVDRIVQSVMCREMSRLRGKEDNYDVWEDGRDPMTYHRKLTEFLKWCFDTPEAYENFVAKYAHDDDFIQLISPTEDNFE